LWNTWRASSRRPLPEPTVRPRACPLASDRAPPSQTVWRSPSSSPCPYLSGHARRPPEPVSVELRRPLPRLHMPASPYLFKHPPHRSASYLPSEMTQTKPLPTFHSLAFPDPDQSAAVAGAASRARPRPPRDLPSHSPAYPPHSAAHPYLLLFQGRRN
jgi:hypothetical protein